MMVPEYILYINLLCYICLRATLVESSYLILIIIVIMMVLAKIKALY